VPAFGVTGITAGPRLLAGLQNSNTVVSLETLVYSIEQDSLVWAGLCKTTDPNDIQKPVREIADAAGKKIRKAGLIR